MVVIPKLLETNFRTVRSYKRYSRVTLHIAPDGRVAIVRGVRRRRGWQSFAGYRESAQAFVQLLKVLPKRERIEVVYRAEHTEVRKSLDTRTGQYISMTQAERDYLDLRYRSFEARLYNWSEVKAAAPLLKAA